MHLSHCLSLVYFNHQRSFPSLGETNVNVIVQIVQPRTSYSSVSVCFNHQRSFPSLGETNVNVIVQVHLLLICQCLFQPSTVISFIRGTTLKRSDTVTHLCHCSSLVCFNRQRSSLSLERKRHERVCSDQYSHA